MLILFTLISVSSPTSHPCFLPLFPPALPQQFSIQTRIHSSNGLYSWAPAARFVSLHRVRVCSWLCNCVHKSEEFFTGNRGCDHLRFVMIPLMGSFTGGNKVQSTKIQLNIQYYFHLALVVKGGWLHDMAVKPKQWNLSTINLLKPNGVCLLLCQLITSSFKAALINISCKQWIKCLYVMWKGSLEVMNLKRIITQLYEAF